MKLSLAAALCLAGCSGAPSSAPTHYALAVDPAFTQDAQVGVMAAAAQWQAAIPALSLDVAVEPCPGGGVVCVRPEPDDLGEPNVLATTWPRDRLVAIYVARIAGDGVSLRRVAMHELGHAMGLLHDAPGTAMAPLYQEQADAPTAEDVEQWETRP